MPISYVTAASLDGTQNGSAPIYAARAWVNFNGTGTVAIRASGNVTSITDNGTGDYTVNFTTAMSDANYSVSGAVGGTNASYCFNLRQTASLTTTSCAVSSVNPTVALADSAYVTVAIFR